MQKVYALVLGGMALVLGTFVPVRAETGTYFGITPEYTALAEKNERVLIAAAQRFLEPHEKLVGKKILVRRGSAPFANPQSPWRIHLGLEVYSPGSERQTGDHFAGMLIAYAPGVHVHSFMKATTQSEDPLTLDEAEGFVSRWLVTGEPVQVYLRGPTAPDVEQTTVCRANLKEYARLKGKQAKDWPDCASVAKIRAGHW